MNNVAMIQELERAADADPWVPQVEVVQGVTVSVESAGGSVTYCRREPGRAWEIVSRAELLADLDAAFARAQRDRIQADYDRMAKSCAAALAANAAAREALVAACDRLQDMEVWLTEAAGAGNRAAKGAHRRNVAALRKARRVLR